MADASAEKLKVFISYSRKDSTEFADELVVGLEDHGFAPFLDRHDITPGEPWEVRLGGLIEQADTIVFVVSPEAVKSPRCVWEVDKTLALSKRLFPAIYRPVPDGDIPAKLRELQLVRFDTGPGVMRPLRELAGALRVDLGWIREHTRLGELAARWQARDRSESLLLRGEEMDAAKAWLMARKDGAPGITEQQRAFVRASEEAESARFGKERAQLQEIARAQAARAKSQRRAKRLLWGGAAVILTMLGGAVLGFWQLYEVGQTVMINKAEVIASQSEQQSEQVNDPVTGMLLALEAVPDAAATRLVQRAMPREISAEHALDRAWRIDTARPWRERRPLSGHTSSVLAVAFSPDGRLVLTGSADRTARLWEVVSGKSVATLSEHTDSVTAVAFSPDGRQVATGPNDGTARLWGTASGKAIATLSGHTKPFGRAGVAFSPDGRLLLTNPFGDYNTAGLWDTASGKAVATLTNNWPVTAVAFSPDGRLVLMGATDMARLWDTVSGNAIATLSMGPVSAVAFSPDGRLVLTGGSSKNTAQLWEVASRKLVATLSGHTRSVMAVAFSPDGRLALTGSLDNTARLWEVASGKSVATLSGHTDSIREVAFSPDGRLVLTGSDDNTARLWETASGSAIATLSGHTDAITAVAFSPDGPVRTTTQRGYGRWRPARPSPQCPDR
jgi:WD40 repeat protein